MRFVPLVVLAAATAQPAFACDLCAVYAATEAQGPGAGFFAGLAQQFTHFGTVQEDGHRLSNTAHQYIESSVSQMFVGYNFSPRFGLQFNVPVIYRSFQRPRGAVLERGTETGIGDASLLGNLVAYQKIEEHFALNWTVLGGLKFPTGDSHRLKEPDVASVPPLPDSGIGGHDLALGSGSFDGIVGTGLSARWDRVFLTANVQYAIRTEGDFGHRYANDLTWAMGPGVYLLRNERHMLSVQAVVSGESKAKDTFHGVPDGDSAETLLYLGPQINYFWSSKLSAQLGADLPMNVRNSGVQVVPDYRLRFSVTWRF